MISFFRGILELKMLKHLPFRCFRVNIRSCGSVNVNTVEWNMCVISHSGL